MQTPESHGERPQENQPCSRTFSLQSCEKIYFCCISHSVFSILLWQPQQTNTLTIRIHALSFHFFRSLIFFIKILQFSWYGSCTYFVRFIPKYFFPWFGAYVNDTVFSISSSNPSSLAYRKAIDFCILPCILKLYYNGYYFLEFPFFCWLFEIFYISNHVIYAQSVLFLPPQSAYVLISFSCLIAKL